MDDIGCLSIAQEIYRKKHGLLDADNRTSRRNGRSHFVVCLPALQLFVQFGAKRVFKAHAAPLGLRENLINALKLLANRQKDGDSPIQRIATGLHERSRGGIMDGLTRLVQADNHSAVDVGGLR